MKKLIIYFLLTLSYNPAFALETLKNEFLSLKKLRSENHSANSSLLSRRVSFINNILEGKTATVSKTVSATSLERITILGGLFQNEIVTHHNRIPLKCVKIQATYSKSLQNHLAALDIMTQGVRGLVNNPFLALSHDRLLAYLTQIQWDNYKFVHPYLNRQAIEILFPQGFFKHVASYAYNFHDYQAQDPLRVALAIDLKGDTISSWEGYELPRGEKRFFEIEKTSGPFDRVIEMKAGSQPIPMRTVTYRQLSADNDENTFQTLFNYPLVNGYFFISHYDLQSSQEKGGFSAYDVLARLSTGYYKESPGSFQFFTNAQGEIFPMAIIPNNSRTMAFDFETLCKNQTNSHDDLLRALKNLPRSLQTEQTRKLRFILVNLKTYHPDSYLFSKELSDLFVIRERKLALSDHAYNQISLVQKAAYERLKKEAEIALVENFKRETQIVYAEYLLKIIEGFLPLLDISSYRSKDFIEGICSKLTDPELKRSIEEQNFIGFIETSPGDVRATICFYIFCIKFLNDFVPILTEEIDRFWESYKRIILSDLINNPVPNEDCKAQIFKEKIQSYQLAIGYEGWTKKRLNYLQPLLAHKKLILSLGPDFIQNFSLHDYYPRWSPDTQRLDFPYSIAELVSHYNADPFQVSLNMFIQIEAYISFFANESNKRLYAYDYTNIKGLTQDLKDHSVFKDVPESVCHLLSKLYINAVWGE